MPKSKMYAVLSYIDPKVCNKKQKKKKREKHFYKDAWYSCVENGCGWMDRWEIKINKKLNWVENAISVLNICRRDDMIKTHTCF